ncbi:MAG: RsmB/NOP family class I SAM-dependent RNA methyltransferase [Thermoproteus sp.]|nr:RsmB/NOP family class I SAM-dependent RNA methyltransferase [Thermoproteus sp.]
MDFSGIRIDKALYRNLLQYMSDSEVEEVFKRVRTPPARYYIRVNTAKIRPEDLAKRLSKYFEVHRDEHLREALWMPVLGPREVPEVDRKVVADKRAAESVYMGSDLYAPGVLKASGVRAGDEVNIVSPDGRVVAYGIAEMDGHDMLKLRRGLAVRVLRSVYSAPKLRNLWEYEEGLFYDQSMPAMWVGAVAAALGARSVVDLNAAPGGKATHAAQMGIRVIAFDRSRQKAKKILENIERLGLDIDVLVHDSRFLDRDFPRLRADVAFVDPPCSDLGVRPKLYQTVTIEDVDKLAKYQRQFLSTALKIADYVVYSTCTLTFSENEGNVLWAVEELGAEVIDVEVPPAAGGWECAGCKRFMPHIQDTPGFFLAVLRRRP